jgi:hypothetical protein
MMMIEIILLKENFLKKKKHEQSRQGWVSKIAYLWTPDLPKENILKVGSWQIGVKGFGEFLSYDDNSVTLSITEKDK